MVEMLLSGGCLPRIHLNRLEDGQIEINDGHHRVTAVWASGRAELRPDEYLLIETEKPKSRFYRLGTKYETL